MQWKGFITGTLVGGMTVGSIYFLSDIASLFFQGPKVTELVVENGSLKQENSVLSRMVTVDWVGLSTEQAEERLAKAGVSGASADAGWITAGPVYLKLADGQVVEIQTHCARMASSGCAQEE